MEIDQLIRKATIEKNGAAKEAYRAIKAELLLNESSKNSKPEGKDIHCRYFFIPEKNDSFLVHINELDFSIIKKQAEIREEQISMYEANSRKDLADMYKEQLKYLKELLPPEISKDRIQEAVMSEYPNGYPQKQMGYVIKEIKDMFPTADGKLISEVVREHICN